MRAKAQPGTRSLAFFLCAALTSCTSATRFDPDAGSPVNGITASAAAGATTTAGATSAGTRAADAGAPNASCQPIPCPPAAPWSPMTCACTPSDAGAVGCRPRPCPSGAVWNAMTCACSPNSAGSTAPQCSVDSDCALTMRGCCSCLPYTRDSALAVPTSSLAAVQQMLCSAGQVSCQPCPVGDPDPLAPVLKAGCVAQQCQLVDLRASEISRCVQDSDCVAIGQGCCEPGTDSPLDYVGIHSGVGAPILACVPAPPCAPPPPHAKPEAFCASDAHCAVRRVWRLKGAPSSSCYSPGQNLEHAYDSGAVGCDCASGSPSVCVPDKTGRRVALVCDEQLHWSAVNDGPCGK